MVLQIILGLLILGGVVYLVVKFVNKNKGKGANRGTSPGGGGGQRPRDQKKRK